MLVAFFNYLYYPIMSRLMSVEEFGEVQTIFSFVFISGTILTVFRMIVINITANSKDTGEQRASHTTHNSHTSSVIPSLYTLATLIHIPLVLFLILAGPFLATYFSFSSSFTFSLFALSVALSVPSTFFNAYLNGKNDFASLSLASIIASLGKLVLAFLLVKLGFGVYGAIGGLTIASGLSLAYIIQKSDTFTIKYTTLKHALQTCRPELNYSILILTSLGFITFLYSGDVIIVKRIFSPEIAGMYSGIATIARIIFFATSSIGAVLLSSIKTSNNAKENKRTLLKSLVFITSIGGTIFLLFSLFPVYIITALIGAKYAPYAHLLPTLSFLLLLVSVLNLLISYLLALRSFSLIIASSVGAITLTILICIFHSTLEAIITDFTIATSITILLLGILAYYRKQTA